MSTTRKLSIRAQFDCVTKYTFNEELSSIDIYTKDALIGIVPQEIFVITIYPSKTIAKVPVVSMSLKNNAAGLGFTFKEFTEAADFVEFLCAAIAVIMEEE